MSEQDFFEKLGLTVDYVENDKLSLNEVYPIYGCITEVIENTDEDFIVVVNTNIKLRIQSHNAASRDLIVGRIFEPGIFISVLTSYIKDNNITSYNGICKTIIYGKQKQLDS